MEDGWDFVSMEELDVGIEGSGCVELMKTSGIWRGVC